MKPSLLLLAACAVLAPDAKALAQEDVPLSQFLSNFVTSAARLDGTLTPPIDHSTHFVLDTQLNEVPRALSQALGVQLTTFPFTSDWPGVHYGATPRAGAAAAARLALFGSSFVERGATSGARRLGLGFSHHTAQFKWIDGLDLREGITLFFRHNETSDANAIGDLQPESERDLLQETISVRLDRTVFNFALSYGLSERIDIGVLVPITKVSFDGRITGHVVRTATAATPETHTFDRLELDHKTIYATRNVHGIGDLRVRAKVQLAGDEEGGLAVGLGVRVPSGDSDNFLGVGTTGADVSVMWSDQKGAIGPHLNASYSMGFGSVDTDFGTDTTIDPPKEVSVAGGLDVSFHPRWTMSGDVLARRLQDTTRFAAEDTVFPSRGPGPLGTAAPFTAENVAFVSGRSLALNQVYAVIGTKILIGRQLLFHGDVVLPLVKDGLTPRPIAVAGVGVAF